MLAGGTLALLHGEANTQGGRRSGGREIGTPRTGSDWGRVLIRWSGEKLGEHSLVLSDKRVLLGRPFGGA